MTILASAIFSGENGAETRSTGYTHIDTARAGTINAV